MKRRLLGLSILLGIGSSLFIATSAEARINVIISTPPPMNVVVAPTGFVNCWKVPSGFYNGVWVHKHRMCEYSDGRIWVERQAHCTRYNPQTGVCHRWKTYETHWVSPTVVEYGVPTIWYEKHHHHKHGW